jgi:uncharacterized protein YkwD
MKKIMRTVVFVLTLVMMNSCSADTADGNVKAASNDKLVTNFAYNESELETMQLINNYRVSIGLNALEKINHVSFKCEEHNDYMIANDVVNHNDFVERADNIITLLGAKNVGENVAYNYKTSQAALDAWLLSPEHKKNIEGNYTHFGLSVETDVNTGKKYYTNIFVTI